MIKALLNMIRLRGPSEGSVPPDHSQSGTQTPAAPTSGWSKKDYSDAALTALVKRYYNMPSEIGVAMGFEKITPPIIERYTNMLASDQEWAAQQTPEIAAAYQYWLTHYAWELSKAVDESRAGAKRAAYKAVEERMRTEDQRATAFARETKFPSPPPWGK